MDDHRRHPDRRGVLRGGLALLAGGALTGCARDPAPSPARLRLATGPSGAVFREIGAVLADMLRERLPDARVTAMVTAASTENMRLLRENAADIAFSSLDAAVGRKGEIPTGVAALGRVYDSHLHLAVPDGSDVRGFQDLAGLRVSLGARGSGTEFTVRRLLELTGLDIEDVLMDQADSATALRAGTIDAFFSVTGLPTPAVTGLAEEGGLTLVPLERQAERLADAHPGSYIPATIPATAYPDVPACPTVAIPNLLLARTDLPRSVAATVTEAVFSRASAIAAERPEAAHINVRTGIATGPIPLHPGAAAWFRDTKT